MSSICSLNFFAFSHVSWVAILTGCEQSNSKMSTENVTYLCSPYLPARDF